MTEPDTAAKPAWNEPRGLLAATLWAVGAAILVRAVGAPGAALALGTAAWLTSARSHAGPWIAAVPAALAAIDLPQEETPAATRRGPVRIDAEIVDVRPGDRHSADTLLRLRSRDGRTAPVLCAVQGELAVLPGDRVVGTARAGGGDRLFLHALAEALHVEPGAPTFARVAERCRRALEASLLAALPDESGVLLCHLVLGRGPPLPADLVAAHRDTGLTHLLAVSGAHASMLACLLALAFGVFAGRRPSSSRPFRWFCVVFLLVYSAITGMDPPVFRALVAFSMVLFAHSRGRRVSVCAALSAPALLTALCAPGDLFGASFCLSYAAVLGLALSGALRARSWRERFVRAPLVGSVWATLLTMPLTLVYFGQVAPWTILATPLLAPVVAGMLALGLVVSCAGLVSASVAAAGAAPLHALTSAYTGAVRATAELPWAPIQALGRPDPWLLGVCAAVGLSLLVARTGRASVAALCALLAVPHFIPAAAATPRLELSAVGHGQACVAHTPDQRRVVVDCGNLGRGSLAARRVLEGLGSHRTIDLLVVTHAHHDHYAGVSMLLRQCRVVRAAMPDELLESDLGLALVAHGAELLGIPMGNVRHFGPGVHVSRPDVTADDVNDHGLWVWLNLGTFTALLTGDALEHGVAAWIAGPHARRADVLVVPHHGRANERLAELLGVVQPRLALVSNASEPGWTAQARAARHAGVRVLETGRVGGVRIDAGPPVRIHTEKSLRLR